MNPVIAKIRAEFADAEGWPKTAPLDRAVVIEWMQSGDLEVLGAVHRLLQYKSGLERTQPPLDFDDYFEFMTRYYRRCLCEYSDTNRDNFVEAHASWEASHAVVGWFVQLWRDKSVPRSALHNLKEWMAETTEVGPRTRSLMASALRQHLFQQRRFRKFFADWESDPRLHDIVENLDSLKDTST
jgi:hypothetical protein